MIIILCFEKIADNSCGGLMLKRATIAIIIFVSLIFSVKAATVSFYVIEAGLSGDVDLKQSQSILWENAFLDVFFDEGYIITNAPIMRLEKKPSDILQVVDITEARGFGVDYMLIVLLDYKKELPAPNEVSFYIYKVLKKEKVLEKKIPLKREYSQEDYLSMKSIAKGFVPYIGE